jgi:hypothetical protein
MYFENMRSRRIMLAKVLFVLVTYGDDGCQGDKGKEGKFN